MNPYPLVGLNHLTLPVGIIVSCGMCQHPRPRKCVARLDQTEFWGMTWSSLEVGGVARQTEKLGCEIVGLNCGAVNNTEAQSQLIELEKPPVARTDIRHDRTSGEFRRCRTSLPRLQGALRPRVPAPAPQSQIG